jgi:hypothetical protein
MKTEISAEQYNRIANRTMPEREWRKIVKEMASIHGWEVLLEIPDQAYKELADALMPFNPVTKRREAISGQAMTTLKAIKAWPDLFIGHRNMGRAIALELKTEKGVIEPEQTNKLNLLQECGIPANIWRPRNRDLLDRYLSGGE